MDHVNAGRHVDHINVGRHVDHLGGGFSNNGVLAIGLSIGGRHRGHHDDHRVGFGVFADFYQPSYGHHRYARPYRHHYARYIPYRSLYGYGYHHHGYYGVSLYPAYGYDDYVAVDNDYVEVDNITVYNSYPQAEAAAPCPVVVEETVETTLPAEPIAEATGSVVYEETTTTVPGGAISETAPTAGPSPEPAAPTPAGPLAHAAEGGAPNEPTLVDLGNAAFNVGAYRDAIRYYTAAVLADDNDGFARLFYGLAQFAIGDYDLAVVAIRRALALEPSLITEPIDLRSIYSDAKTFERHRDRLLQHVSRSPDEYESMFLAGYVYFATAEPGNALAMFRSVLELKSDDALTIKLRDTAASILSRTPAPPQGPQTPDVPADAGGSAPKPDGL
ncbi:MAG: tetratricopeptide repeat protein [Phycisphaerae bacterium]